MRIILFLFCFVCIFSSKLCSHNSTNPTYSYDVDEIALSKKDTIKGDTLKAKILKKLTKALSFKKNLREKEKTRIVNILNTVLNSILTKEPYSIQKLKIWNEELSKKEKQHFDSLLVILKTQIGRAHV